MGAEDPAGWARSLGVSREAVDLLVDSHVFDLHLDLEVPVRVYGYDPLKRHRARRRPSLFWGHTDLPRLRASGFTGVAWDVATNPFRPPANRQRITLRNLRRIQDRAAAHRDRLAVVTDRAGYDAAHAAGRLAALPALQGGNALIHDLSVLDGPVGELLHRITLVHLTTSRMGGTNSPAGPDRGLGAPGRELVARCNARRIFVDLAHAGKRTFWEALEAHADDVPPLVTHTGVEGVRRHWRNVDDDQIRAIVERGGVVGIMYQSQFLAPVLLYARRSHILDHLEHVIRVGGEEAAAIGTDYDGAIVPPGDLPDITHHPRLVQDMLDRGWSEDRIRRVLGGNALRVLGEVRPGDPEAPGIDPPVVSAGP
jgi:membrane dipeptidase